MDMNEFVQRPPEALQTDCPYVCWFSVNLTSSAAVDITFVEHALNASKETERVVRSVKATDFTTMHNKGLERSLKI